VFTQPPKISNFRWGRVVGQCKQSEAAVSNNLLIAVQLTGRTFSNVPSCYSIAILVRRRRQIWRGHCHSNAGKMWSGHHQISKHQCSESTGLEYHLQVPACAGPTTVEWPHTSNMHMT